MKLLRLLVAAWCLFLAALAAVAQDEEAYDELMTIAGGER